MVDNIQLNKLWNIYSQSYRATAKQSYKAIATSSGEIKTLNIFCTYLFFDVPDTYFKVFKIEIVVK